MKEINWKKNHFFRINDSILAVLFSIDKSHAEEVSGSLYSDAFKNSIILQNGELIKIKSNNDHFWIVKIELIDRKFSIILDSKDDDRTADIDIPVINYIEISNPKL